MSEYKLMKNKKEKNLKVWALVEVCALLSAIPVSYESVFKKG